MPESLRQTGMSPCGPVPPAGWAPAGGAGAAGGAGPVAAGGRGPPFGRPGVTGRRTRPDPAAPAIPAPAAGPAGLVDLSCGFGNQRSRSWPRKGPQISTDSEHATGLSIDRVRAAAARVAGIAHRTPLLTSTTLDNRCGGSVCLKAEPFQRGGAFKFRGAYNRLSLLDADERARGVVAYSSGNHGAAVALAAAVLGIHAVVVVPETGSPAKLAAIEGYGAEIRRYDPARERREVVAAVLAEERSLTVIAPFDDYDVMAGQGTLGLELAEQAGELDLVLVPVGGGGLAAGVATAVTAVIPGVEVIGVKQAAPTTLAGRCGQAGGSA